MNLFTLLALAAASPIESDTLRNFNIEEAVVVSSPKETGPLRRQALSVQLFHADQLSKRGVTSAKDLSQMTPNVYMPDYGSRLSSACYIRGIGSRINTPAVGLYVDNVPYVDKSSYDFSFQNVDRVDLLRGPQGTLYGQNTMGGLLHIYTANPMTHKGTDISAGWTSRTGGRRASFTTFLHPSNQMGLSLTGYYTGENGFYRNQTTGKKQDGSESAGGRLRWSWRPTSKVKMDWTASYEYSDEEACPYFLLPNEKKPTPNPFVGTISQNRPSSYRRDIFNTGLTVEHRLPKLTFSSITSYQYLNDRLFMDQDFTALDIFSLEQRQKSHAVTEELALKNKPESSVWQWTTGVYAMYRHLDTGCPVNFYQDGMHFLNKQFAQSMPPFVALKFTGENLPFNAALSTPSANIALYHQSTVQLPVEGLSFTLGARLDYNHMKLNLTSGLDEAVPYHLGIKMGKLALEHDFAARPEMNSNITHDDWQVLPKAAVNYQLPEGLGNVYLSATKGYRAGGYNIQAYSDLSQNLLRRNMMLDVKDYCVTTINRLPMPEETKQNAIKGMTAMIDANMPAQPHADELYYKPEYTWSYEAGAHLNFMDKKLQFDVSAFLMSTRDQQLARFAQSGMGRVMVNAGRSRSCGVETALRSRLWQDRLELAATYGYTHAVFTHYDLGKSPVTKQELRYDNNRVPFVPEHTFSFTADYEQPLNHRFFKAFSLGSGVQGAGSIYWDEANQYQQKFYATLTAHAGLKLAGQVEVEVWGRNLTGARYSSFTFESMGNRFAQYATPRHFGADIKWHF